MKFTRTFALLGCIAAISISPCFAQEAAIADAATTAIEETATVAAATETAAAVPAVPQIANTQNGVLKGKVFTEENGVQNPINAKVTLSSDGVVLDSVEADDNGEFAFEGIEPGSYQLLGSADGYVGGQAYDVQPYTTGAVGGCSTCNLGLQSVQSPVTETVYQAPASACGCSGGGGGGGGLAGGGGGLLNGRRLLALGAAGGIIAIAVSDDDDDDLASPEQ